MEVLAVRTVRRRIDAGGRAPLWVASLRTAKQTLEAVASLEAKRPTQGGVVVAAAAAMAAAVAVDVEPCTHMHPAASGACQAENSSFCIGFWARIACSSTESDTPGPTRSHIGSPRHHPFSPAATEEAGGALLGEIVVTQPLFTLPETVPAPFAERRPEDPRRPFQGVITSGDRKRF